MNEENININKTRRPRGCGNKIAFIIGLSMFILFKIVSSMFFSAKEYDGTFADIGYIISTVFGCALIFFLIKKAIAGSKAAKIILIIMAVLLILAIAAAIYIAGMLCDGALTCCNEFQSCPG